MSSPFKIHTVIDRGQQGADAFDEQGRYLYTLNPTGLAEVQAAFPQAQYLTAQAASFDGAPRFTPMDFDTTFVNEARVVALATGSVLQEVNAYDTDAIVLGVTLESGSGEIKVCTDVGNRVRVEIEAGGSGSISKGTELYLGAAEVGKVTPVEPTGAASILMGVATDFPSYGDSPSGGDWVEMLLLRHRKLRVELS